MSVFDSSITLYLTFITCYTIASLLGFIVDYSMILEHKKIKNRTKGEYLELYKKITPTVCKNVYIYSYPYMYSVCYLNDTINNGFREYNSNNIIALFQFYICFQLFRFLSDIIFYSAHRLLHTKYLYKYHKKHHEIKNPIIVSALYMGIIDLYFSNLSPLALTFILLNYNILTAQIFIFLQIIFSLPIAHGGYNNISEDHNFHHTLFKYNFGSSSSKLCMDNVFKTNYIENDEKKE
tara:strand:+ start:809 stop:1516 length:708 start_codon:yes stop_codon:yes gene_type:complete